MPEWKKGELAWYIEAPNEDPVVVEMLGLRRGGDGDEGEWTFRALDGGWEGTEPLCSERLVEYSGPTLRQIRAMATHPAGPFDL